MRGLSFIGAALVGALLTAAGAGGALWLTGWRPGEIGGGRPDAAAPAAVQPRTEVDLQDVEQLLSIVEPERRAQILASPELFKQFVEQEALNQSVVRAALANQAERNPLIAELMQRAAQRILAQAYLNQVVAANLDAGFPSDAQVQSYFDENSTRFTTPDRVHMWQIFLPLAQDAPAGEAAAVEQRANDIALRLKQGQSDFATEAANHSAHLQSRVNDGYMGLLRVDDLLPEVRAEVETLAEEAISKPVRSSTGFHILKRGALVKGQPLKLDEVQPRIRALLRREGENRVRSAAADKIRESYPTGIASGDLETWRARLGGAPAAAAAAP